MFLDKEIKYIKNRNIALYNNLRKFSILLTSRRKKNFRHYSIS